MRDIKSALVHAATAYDRKREGKPGHNPYALPQYLAAIDDAMAAIAKGYTPPSALRACFNDRLLDALLVAIGEPKASNY